MGRWLKIVLWIFGSVLGLLLILIAVALWMLTPAKLTPLVNKYATQYIRGEVNFSRVEVSLFEKFPDVELSIMDGNIRQNVVASTDDTLLHFSRLSVSLDVMDLVRGVGVTINSFGLDGARAKVIVDSVGIASWDIVKSDDTTPKEEAAGSAPLVFNISQVDISGGMELSYIDMRDTTTLAAHLNELTLRGVASSKLSLTDVSQISLSGVMVSGSWGSAGDSFRFSMPSIEIKELERKRRCAIALDSRTTLVARGDTLINDLPLNFSSTVSFDLSKNNIFNIEKSKLDVSRMTLSLAGKVDLASDSTINSDLSLSLDGVAMDELINLVPKSYQGALARINTNITLELGVKIDGTYNFKSGKLPHIEANVAVDKGYLRYRGAKTRIDEFSIVASALYNPDNPSLSSVELEKLRVRSPGISITASGRASDVLGDPLIEASILSQINLGVLSLEFPPSRGVMATGEVKLKAGCDARLSNLSLHSIAKTFIHGSAQMHNVSVTSPKDSLYFMTEGRLSFGANKTRFDSTWSSDMAILRAQLSLDTLSFKMGRNLAVNGRNVDVSARASAERYSDKDLKRIHPFRGTIKSGALRMVGFDSTLFMMRDPLIDFAVRASDNDSHIPLLTTTVAARTIVARSPDGRAIASDPRFTFSATILSREQDSILRAEALLDRLAKRYPTVERDNLLKYNRMMQMVGIAKKDDLASGDLDLKMDDDMISLMRRWRSTGRIQARRVRLITPYIPLPTTLTMLDFTFDNNSIELVNSKLQVGRSDLSLRGHISNLSRALSGRGNLVAALDVVGDTLDINQLVVAANAGFSMADKVKAIVSDSTSEEQVAQIIKEEVADQTLNRLIIVPKNVELNIKLRVDEAFYGDITMSELVGELISRDRILQINHLKTASSIGQMELNAVYATRSKIDITTGFDLTLSGVNVKELIELIPEVDSLLPMLKSFEGHLDCALAATASLDSTMSILIPTLNAAGSISGRNLVLLDGETFTEISKILRFKNKSRNMVDKISVEMLIRNSAVEIFPFVLELDRYKAAVSGVQRLDMNFDYHVSVLKSIIPFRVGVDIFGNLDNWDFKVTKARYKNENVPSYTTLIDTTRVDLRRAITDIFSAGLNNLVLKETDVVPHIDSTELRVVDSLDSAELPVVSPKKERPSKVRRQSRGDSESR